MFPVDVSISQVYEIITKYVLYDSENCRERCVIRKWVHSTVWNCFFFVKVMKITYCD